jgi:undecaprenyl-diphosphatase
MKSDSGYGGLLLLGLIQGLTEFLPVSSSGHLVLGQHVLKLAEPSLVIDVVLHVGTLVPVLWLYRRDLWEMVLSLRFLPTIRARWAEEGALRLTVCVVVGTIPTALAGVLLKSIFERLFSSTLAVGIALLCTGGILMLTRIRRQLPEGLEPFQTLTPLRAVIVGCAQSAAITPGISRSGSTIATGLLLGIEREMAARLSFVMSIPAILGAVVLSLRKAQLAGGQAGLLALGAVAAAVSGYLALRWVVHLVKKGEMHWFSYYLWPLGIAVLIWTFMAH